MHPTMTILYVESARRSAAFYASLCDCEPVELQDTFGLFCLPNGMRLGLWSRAGVAPAANQSAGATELCFALDTNHAVDEALAHWKKRDITIIQQPVRMDFGYTFTALDPDGHRLRVYCAAPA